VICQDRLGLLEQKRDWIRLEELTEYYCIVRAVVLGRAARSYLDALDDRAIWRLLRERRATATRWQEPEEEKEKEAESLVARAALPPPPALVDCLVSGVRYLHPVRHASSSSSSSRASSSSAS
jgi:hypothetical protein